MKRRELGPALRSLHPIATFGVQRLYYFFAASTCFSGSGLRSSKPALQSNFPTLTALSRSCNRVLYPSSPTHLGDFLRVSPQVSFCKPNRKLSFQATASAVSAPKDPSRSAGTTVQPLASLHGKTDTSNALRSTTSVEKPGKLLKSTQDRMATGEVASRNSAAAVSPKPLPSNLVR